VRANFGLLGFWGANGAKGNHVNYTFENLFLDNWYSLEQMDQKYPGLLGFTFHNIWALDQPPLADSTIVGDVAGVTFDNVKYGQKRAAGNADLPLSTATARSRRSFPHSTVPWRHLPLIRRCLHPERRSHFTAQSSPGASYTWLFGDGTEASGRRVHHRFADAEGTELDGAEKGAGRFRVLLHVAEPTGNPDTPIRIGPRRVL